MDYNSLITREAKYYPQSFSPDILKVSDVENYLNDHRYLHDELKVIRPTTQMLDYYANRHQPWRNAYDPDTMEMLWNSGYSFILHSPFVSASVKNIVKWIELSNNVSCDAHVYLGRADSKSFPPHCDHSYNLIVQCVGETRWRVWTGITEPETYSHMNYDPYIDVVMTPGDSIFIPKGQIHQAVALTDRMSVSFPFYAGPKTIQRDIKLKWGQS